MTAYGGDDPGQHQVCSTTGARRRVVTPQRRDFAACSNAADWRGAHPLATGMCNVPLEGRAEVRRRTLRYPQFNAGEARGRSNRKPAEQLEWAHIPLCMKLQVRR